MIASRQVLLTDTFSHTVSGKPWPNYEWLGEVVFAAVHHTGGMPLLTAVCAAAVLGGLLCIYVVMKGGDLARALLITGVIGGATLTWSVRPQVFSQLLLGVTTWLLVKRRWQWLPVTFLVWANLHGAVAWGVVLLAAFAVGHLWQHRAVPSGLMLAAAGSGVATLFTPLAVNYWPEIVASVQRSKANDIAEWHAPEFLPGNPVFWVAVALFAVLSVTRYRRLESAEERGIFVGAVLLMPLALMTMRNITPFLMMCAVAASYLIPQERHRDRDKRSAVHQVLVGGAALVVVGLVTTAWSRGAERLGWTPMTGAAARAVASCSPPLYNRYADGGAIIFFAPPQKVLIDSRQDPYPVELFRAQHEVEESGQYRELFRKYGINCAALPPSSPTVRRLLEDGWVLRFQDAQWMVLERAAPAPFRQSSTAARRGRSG
jgi:hypothetical protein